MQDRTMDAGARRFGAGLRPFLVLFLAIAASLSAATPSQAGFLEDLFGFGQSEQARPAGPSYHAPRHARPERRRMVVHRHHERAAAKFAARGSVVADASVAGSKPVRPDMCYSGAPTAGNANQTESLMHDATLRAGDTLVTDEGVRIFAGRAACPHRAGDFLTLAEAGRMPNTKHVALLAIEKTMKLHRNYTPRDAVVATDRDESPSHK